MRSQSLFVVILLFFSVAAFPQTSALNGTVTSGGAPVSGVVVTVNSPRLPAPLTAQTDSVGNYTFPSLLPGVYTVRFELQGLETMTKEVTIDETGSARVDADLNVGAYAEEVTVTGSLIPRPSVEAMSPVSTLDPEDLTYRGLTRLEDIVASLPQISASQNSTISNMASGTATVSLRNVGEVRTLVLIDGRRMSAGDPLSPGGDLNFIPSSLVKRVDLLTGGASATYGADALAGVVNVILDKDLQGVRGGITFGGYNHNNDDRTALAIQKARGFSTPTGEVWDGGVLDANVAMGGTFGDGKGHATAYVDYRSAASLMKSRRDYTNCSVAALGRNGPVCGGSSTIPTGRFTVYDPEGRFAGDYTLDVSGTGDTFTPRRGLLFNYATDNFMQRPDKRLAGGAFLDYGWGRKAQGYLEIMFMNDVTDAQIAPSGDFYGNTVELNCDNPMLSDQQRKVICEDPRYGPHDIATVVIGRRSTESGPRVEHRTHNSWRQVAGVNGDLSNAWSYDVYGLNAEVSVPESQSNEFNILHLQDALIVDGDRNDPSTWHCRSGNAGCAPWNIFKAGAVTPEALQYLRLTLVSNGGTKTRMVSGRLTGDLKDYGLISPSAREGVRVVVGADYGDFLMYLHPDQAYQDGIGAGSGGPVAVVDGSYNVREAFTELLVPVVQGARAAKDLSLELGYRVSEYSTTGTHPTYKAQGAWAPNDLLKFRAGFNRATRSPNVMELFYPQSFNTGGYIDKCAGEHPSATLEECERTGVTAAQYGQIQESPAAQYRRIEGGNPNLKPEVGDTVSYGLVVTLGSSVSVAFDYFDIRLDDSIGSLGPGDIMSACMESGDPKVCSLIHRDQFGSLWIVQRDAYVMTANTNIGTVRSRGVDANVSYTRPIGRNLLSSSIVGTYLLTSETSGGLFSYDCVGYFGNTCNNFFSWTGGLTPRWRHLARLSWQRDNLSLTLGWRMMSAMKNEVASSNPHLADPDSIPLWKLNGSYEIPAAHYVDLAATYTMAHGMQFTVGVNNLTDREPPLGAGLTTNDYAPGFVGMYDAYGRYIHSSLDFKF